MRTSRKPVTFTQPFTMPGIDGTLPAGTYSVETDEELLMTLLHPASRRLATWLVVPSRALGAGFTQFANIDPADLEAALIKDALGGWSVAAEANVDELLAGHVMKQAVHSAGLTLPEFKDQLRDLASRLGRTRDARSD